MAEKEERHWSRSVIAGAGAGCATSLVTCPMDVVKTRLQSQSIPRSVTGFPLLHSLFYNTESAKSSVKFNKQPYRGTVPSLRRIFREEGWRGLYRGLAPTIVGYLPAHAIYFSVYSNAKHTLAPYLAQNTYPNHIAAAMMGGAVAATATNPLWVIRTRLMTQAPGRTPFYYRSTVDAARKILALEGWRGLYKGLGPSLLGLAHVAIQFPLYERIKMAMLAGQERGDERVFVAVVLLASMVSKVTAAVVTYPHEVLRTRLQSQSGPKPKYRGIVHGACTMWREEGLLGFYRGLGTTIMRVVPASAVTLLTFEFLYTHLP